MQILSLFNASIRKMFQMMRVMVILSIGAESETETKVRIIYNNER